MENYYRAVLREARLDDVDEVDVEAEGNLEELLLQDDERTRTLETLARVREDYRVLLRWRYWDLKSASEMAALSGRTEKSVERALARARAQFKTLWEARA